MKLKSMLIAGIMEGKMSDQCGNCTIRGDIKKCLETDCFQHEDWWAKTVLAQLAEAQKEAFPAYKREKALRCKAEFELAEARKENEELKTHAYAVAKDLRKRMNEQDALWQETAQHLLERAEKAEAENAELRARLEPVKDVYNMVRTCSEEEMWQAIKAACEA